MKLTRSEGEEKMSFCQIQYMSTVMYYDTRLSNPKLQFHVQCIYLLAPSCQPHVLS